MHTISDSNTTPDQIDRHHALLFTWILSKNENSVNHQFQTLSAIHSWVAGPFQKTVISTCSSHTHTLVYNGIFAFVVVVKTSKLSINAATSVPISPNVCQIVVRCTRILSAIQPCIPVIIYRQYFLPSSSAI